MPALTPFREQPSAQVRREILCALADAGPLDLHQIGATVGLPATQRLLRILYALIGEKVIAGGWGDGRYRYELTKRGAEQVSQISLFDRAR